MDKEVIKIAGKIVAAGALMVGSFLLGKHGKTVGKEAYNKILKQLQKRNKVV